jgi:acyl-CoA reductase-like NAD-dependent aldehyde dehydrogenase
MITISDAADFTMKIGFVTINDQNQQWANWYKEAVEKGSNGRIEVQIYPASQLGPVAGIMKVSSDDEAVDLMNDSDFGLTAAIWTEDEDVALRLGQRVNTGTWFMNRCDYLDPALAWVGVKDSGRGCTLSVVGYEHLTRPKSFHMRLKTQ